MKKLTTLTLLTLIATVSFGNANFVDISKYTKNTSEGEIINYHSIIGMKDKKGKCMITLPKDYALSNSNAVHMLNVSCKQFLQETGLKDLIINK